MKIEFTHNAKFYGIPCFFNNDNGALKGKNRLFDILLQIAVFIEMEFPSNDEGFPILIKNKLPEGKRMH